MIKMILSGIAGAATMGASGYTYVHNKDVTIEAQARSLTEVHAQLDASAETLKSKNALIDHVIQELRESRQ